MVMKRKVLIALSIIGCLSLASATETVNWEAYEKAKDVKQHKESKQKELIVKIEILLDDAIEIGTEALASLEGDLKFLEQVENDDNFRDCVVLKENRNKIVLSKETAKELLETREVTQKQYDKYIVKLNGLSTKLDLKISKTCK